jgi:hypothetical protein
LVPPGNGCVRPRVALTKQMSSVARTKNADAPCVVGSLQWVNRVVGAMSAFKA